MAENPVSYERLFICHYLSFKKKTQNCPKTSVFDQKTTNSWSIFPEKKIKNCPTH